MLYNTYIANSYVCIFLLKEKIMILTLLILGSLFGLFIYCLINGDKL